MTRLPVPDIIPGDVLSAGRLNSLKRPGEAALDQVSNITGTGGISGSTFPGGLLLKGGYNPGLVLYELPNQLTYPTDVKSAPFVANCKPVIHDLNANQEVDSTEAILQTLYFPNALIDSDGDYIGLPLFGTDVRVYAIMNQQSGRLEIFQNDHNYVYWGKLNAAMEPSDTGISVSIWVKDDAGLVDTDIDILADAPPVLIGTGLDSDDWVSVTWFPDDRTWYVTSAPCA